jgi:hypothetical protein
MSCLSDFIEVVATMAMLLWRRRLDLAEVESSKR